MKTLLLDQTAWDLVLDAHGNIAVASPPYATAQDVASAQRTLKYDCWYDQARGMPYLEKVLATLPSPIIVKHFLQQAALMVPNVSAANVSINFNQNDRLIGKTELVYFSDLNSFE